MTTQYTPEQLIEIENQLRCPNGEFGLEVAKVMHTNNLSMTQSAIDALEFATEDVVLEIGHGSAAHLNGILNQGKNISYHGLEISETMHQEAKRINKANKDLNNVNFRLYDGEQLPYEENFFHKILTVNTLYFWAAPATFLNDIFRVLMPGGRCAIALGNKSYMESLPYVNQQFDLYDDEKLAWLIGNSPFKTISIKAYNEVLQEAPVGNQNRIYSVVLLEK